LIWSRMEHEAQFRFRCDSVEEIFASVQPEMAGEVNPRSHARCWCECPDTLVLRVTAVDIPALRASLNMWLRLINVAREMQELVTERRR
jgi:KEOPS complex subunit Pcc1